MFNKKVFYFLKVIFVFLFLASSIGKLLDNRGFSEVLKTYQLVPDWSVLSLGLAVSLFELFLGLALIFNKRLILCAQLCVLVHIGYLSLATITILRGIELQNCGCFGVFLARPLGIQTLVEDTILLLVSILFLLVVKKQKELI